MKIKKRLILSNTVTIVIPFVITIVTAFAFIYISSNVFKKDIGYDNFKNLVIIKSELLDVAKETSHQNPETVLDAEFKKYLSKRLSALNGEIIITRGNTTIFASNDINKIEVEKCLEEIKGGALQKTVKIKNTSYILEVTEIKFNDGTMGNVILLAPVGTSVDILGKFIIFIISIFVISSIIVNIVMSYLFSKRILNPVSLLKNATSKISSGNLDLVITEGGDGEIKELCHDFEVMRIQLKDSIHTKLRYDDNRKMLVSSISHDLKTPITSIKGYTLGILDGVANTPEKIESYLKTIYSKAELVDVMIDDLLLYSKLDLNQLPFTFAKTNIVEYFEYCIFENQAELEKDNIKIHLENNLKNSKCVMIDNERMRRVIMNIIDNSRKYMDKEQGEITLILRETNSNIIAEIRDNGAGIDKNDTNKIFDRFYRADYARTETKGSGLGLAIAKQIVEGHKGTIWALSHENQGTSIMISLAKIREE